MIDIKQASRGCECYLSEKIDNQHISFEDGNIFLTNYQTIVVTVNCVGVMGKGIALLAKHFSPDAYKYYRGLCEKDEMHMGEPVLYVKPSKTLQGPGRIHQVASLSNKTTLENAWRHC